MGITGVSVSLYDQMSEILDEITVDVHDCAEKAAKKGATRARKHLKANSPTKSGEYKRGWSVTQTDKDALYGATFVVYNKKMPGLTHLLENGHVTRNKKGEYGRTPAHPHIVQAAEEGAKVFEEEAKKLIEQKLNG